MIGLIDYGAGNLHSLGASLDRLGRPHCTVCNPRDMEGVEALILPGVGHFGSLMASLDDASLHEPIAAWLRDGRPFLGICLGMQALFAGSEEAVGVAGLQVFDGVVTRLRDAPKLPHMGWNHVAGDVNGYAYFAHSFAAPVIPHTTATAEYGAPFSAIVRRGMVIGCQFHPEKSGAFGQAVLAEIVGGWGC